MSGSIAVIGGSGLSEFFEGRVVGHRQTPYGDTSADIVHSQHAGVDCYFLARHGNPHTIAPHHINYRANLWALHQLGVKQVIAVNAVGGISDQMPTSSLVLPDQLIDYTHGRENSFYDGVQQALQHIDFTHPFSNKLINDLHKVSIRHAIKVHAGGVYGVTQGPRLETAAEIRRLASDGCDIVGMTAMPEAALARELAIDYASVCLVVNPAAGLSAELITMDEIHKVLEQGMDTVKSLISLYIEGSA